jgi:hypothetical protein
MFLPRLEVELGRQLDQAWPLTGGRVVGDVLSEKWTLNVVHDAPWPEAFVVHDIVELDSQLHPCRFGEVRILEQLKIEVVDSVKFVSLNN